MPKQVDHQQRRRLIAEALLRLAAARGLETVSLRHVAAEAGVSAGAVQHYFATKDEMMAFALDTISENVERRMTQTVAELGGVPSPIALCRALLTELLPIDERRRAEGKTALAFLAYRSVNPGIAAQHERSGMAQLHRYLEDLIRADQAPTDPNGEDNATTAATAMLALIDGLCLQVLGEQYTTDTALHVFDVCSTAILDIGRR